jgi:hypothetical protein
VSSRKESNCFICRASSLLNQGKKLGEEASESLRH